MPSQDPTDAVPAPADGRTVHSSARRGPADSALGTRNLMTIAALAVVGMILLLPLNYLAPAAVADPRTLFIGCSIMGLWVVPYLLPATVVRRPGAVMIAALIMGIISVFTTPAGPSAIIGNLLGGAFIEIPLALMLYRAWAWWSYLIGAACFGLINGLLYITVLGTSGGVGTSAFLLAVSVGSALAGGGLTILLTRLLHQAGVAIDHRA
ncbi:ECF transporter S component [Actinomyces bowdenii]|uniref:ECF transporter S component n=1 Tax=Actinomyces bowdenii TaxID=131109 RepID=UPI001ABC797B|nr:ECF transporter S component [Actinomyces bowdenii]MBO3723816.1 ECF transporter S component [Actinomyces bowdenii]